MPISRQEFESGEPDPSLLVMEFLRSNSDYAYTVEELLVVLSARRAELTEKDMLEVLRSLQEREKIEARSEEGCGILYLP